jgi:EAL domain-containing protein (putative c-di-GMP-specific phosphodiesterase class I)
MLFAANDEAEANDIARQIQQCLVAPVFVEGAQLQVSASIGLSWLDPRENETGALRRSDVALYAAKRNGRNSFAWFDAVLEVELSDRLKLEENIRTGIKRGDFVPYFQPLIDLSNQQIVGFEALARWRSPDGTVLDAEAFIEAAERTGLIGPLTLSIMEQSMRQARDWPAHLKLAVNVSPVQFRDPTLAEQILKLLSTTGFPANRLEIEITEASLLEDREQVLTIMASLKNVGVRISLDDFGTGYASLAQVNRLPLDRIKIDKSFITTMVKSQRTAEIVNTIAALGHTLDVPISAEGVESEQIRAALEQFGCSEAQGWLFGRAVSADAVRSFLRMSDAGVGPEQGQAAAVPAKVRRSR